MVVMRFLAVSRRVARGNEVVNAVRIGALMGGCQILVNPTVKSGAT